MSRPPVLILGVPRSGTTWVQDVLGGCAGARVVREPDNETRAPWPLVAKSGLGRFPYLRGGDAARRYERLWRAACAGAREPARVRWARERQRRWGAFGPAEAACDPARRLGLGSRTLAWVARPRVRDGGAGPVLVKSVHAALCAGWLSERIRPVILVVQRDPFEVVASWRSMAARADGFSDRLEYAGRPERILSRRALEYLGRRYGSVPAGRAGAVGWLAAALMSELRLFAAARGDVLVLDFDEACAAPRRVLASAATALGLRWSPLAEGILAQRNRPGSGWDTARVTAEVPGGWRRRLDPASIAEIEATLSRFDLLRPQSPQSP